MATGNRKQPSGFLQGGAHKEAPDVVESSSTCDGCGPRLRVLPRPGEQGGALVEFALLLPILLLLTTGIMVFGVAMNNYLQLTNAVSIGARNLAISAGITLDPCATASATSHA
jgi:hypothetical protein